VNTFESGVLWVGSIDSVVPSPDDFADASERETVVRALEYMGLQPGTPIREIAVDTVFIGSCTNSRIEDLRAAAAVMRGHHVSVPRVMVVPGSHRVKAQAEAEGLHEVFRAAGATPRRAGRSMCLAMHLDKLAPGERAARATETSGRQDVAAAPISSPPSPLRGVRARSAHRNL
jgi:3-isopropylmalate/(R)-2-methylmalate dehydratase large subunit